MFHSCFQGDTTGQGADRKRTHVSWVYVPLGLVPLSLPQRCLRCGYHSRRCDGLHQKARQMPENSEERGRYGKKQFPGVFVEPRGLYRRVTELRPEHFNRKTLTLCCLQAVIWTVCLCYESLLLAVKHCPGGHKPK